MKNVLIAGMFLCFAWACNHVSGIGGQNVNTADSLIVFYDSKGKPEPGAMYPRLIQLQHYEAGKGNLLATFEKYIEEEPSFPIYQSTDNGKTWTLLSTVTDTKNHFGMRYQPQLFEIPQDLPGLRAGTILCAGSSIPKDLSSTELLLFKSEDGGKRWEFVSSVIKGGGAGPTIPVAAINIESKDSLGQSQNPVWEPFLQVDNKGRLLCYYSDEGFKQKGYNQLLAHKISVDGGKSWSDPVIDVAIADSVKRPGMIVTAKLPDNSWIMVYEVVNIPGYPVYCRFSNDGESWGDPKDLGTRITDSSNGYFMSGTPYVVWSPSGGPNGTVIVSAKGTIENGLMTGEGLMFNTNLGKGSWKFKKTMVQYNAKLHPGGYSRSMIVMDSGKKILHLTPVPQKGNQTNLIQTFETVAE
jgi:hypothetical protein